MKLSVRIAAFGVTAAVTVGLMAAIPAACGADVVIRPTTSVQVLDTTSAQDVVYTPIRNDVVTRLPVGSTNVPVLDTMKLQVENGIASGIASGRLVEDEALRLMDMLDVVQRQEAEMKLAGLTEGHVNNLMRKYNSIAVFSNELTNNTIRNDFMPNFENRREAVMRRVLYHMAAANLSPGEGEQLLTSLNQISDNYNIANATGGVLTADELEAAHKDLFNLEKKIAARTAGTIAFVVPASVPERQEYLKKIQAGLASKLLSAEEGAKLIEGYNKLVLLEQSLIASDGARSEAVSNLAQEINNMTFILDRQLKDRAIPSAVAGSSTKM